MSGALNIVLTGLLAGAGGGVLLGWFLYGGHLLILLIGAALVGAGGFQLIKEIRKYNRMGNGW